MLIRVHVIENPKIRKKDKKKSYMKKMSVKYISITFMFSGITYTWTIYMCCSCAICSVSNLASNYVRCLSFCYLLCSTRIHPSFESRIIKFLKKHVES